MKPFRSILDREFKYVPSAATSVKATWNRFGWCPPQERARKFELLRPRPTQFLGVRPRTIRGSHDMHRITLVAIFVAALLFISGFQPAKATEGDMKYETLNVHTEGAVLFAQISAPPMNLLGPEMVRDLVSLIQRAEADKAIKVLVFKSADPDYFISHVDVTRIKEYRAEAAKLVGEPSIALLFRYMSASRLVTIAQIEGRVRGAGSEFVLACDMRFAARESAILGQPEAGLGVAPGAGAIQHLSRLMGRGRALEAMLSSEDFDAELAERYGWINRALPAKELDAFVAALAHRIAAFPAAGLAIVKERVNAISLAPAADFRRDSDLFLEAGRDPEAQSRGRAAMQRGLQKRDAELDLGRWVGELTDR